MTALNVTVIGRDKLQVRIDQMPAAVHAEVYKEVRTTAFDMERYVVGSKLSGQVLNKITGRLQMSIHSDARDDGSAVIGRIFSAAPMPYARPHEFGFTGSETVKAHIRDTIFGRKVKPFLVNSFTRHVNLPERSFLRSTLSDWKEKIVQRLTAAVAKGVAAP